MGKRPNDNNNGKLTGLQRAFVDAWFECRYNGTQAARLAGYQGDDRAMGVQSYRNLRLPKIQAAIAERFSAHGASPDEVVSVLIRQMRAGVGDFIDEHGRVDMAKVRRDGHGLVQELSHDARGEPKIRLYSAQAAAELIGKTFGLFRDVKEHHGEVHFVSVDR